MVRTRDIILSRVGVLYIGQIKPSKYAFFDLKFSIGVQCGAHTHNPENNVDLAIGTAHLFMRFFYVLFMVCITLFVCLQLKVLVCRDDDSYR